MKDEHLPEFVSFLQKNFQVNISTDPDVIEGFSKDGSNLPGHARGLARPQNERECAIVLRACFAAGIPVTFSGGRSNLTGSATPKDGIILSTERMLSPTVQADKTSRTVIAPVGVFLEDMRKAVLEQTGGTLRFPVDPTSRSDAFVGGCLACNASGFTPGPSGAIRAWLRNLRFLLPDGFLIEAERGQYLSEAGKFVLVRDATLKDWPVPAYRRPAVKNAGGPFSAPDEGLDVIDLVAGSEGIFGLVTACTLGLTENPAEYLDIFFSLANETEALRLQEAALEHFAGDLSRLTAFEYFGENCRNYMTHEERFFRGGGQVGIYIQEPLFELGMEDAAERWLDILTAADIEVAEENMLLLDTKALRTLFMEARHSMPARALEVVQHRGAFTIMTDTVVPQEHFREFLDFTHARIRAEKLDYLSFGHLGDCHLHFTILPHRKQIDDAVSVYDDIVARSAALGGVYSGEHGTGKRKRKDFIRCYGEEAVDMVRRSKQAVDPRMLVNPDNVITGENE